MQRTAQQVAKDLSGLSLSREPTALANDNQRRISMNDKGKGVQGHGDEVQATSSVERVPHQLDDKGLLHAGRFQRTEMGLIRSC